MPIRGHAVSRCGQSKSVGTVARQSLVFSPEMPAEISWSADCVQVCLMIPRAGLEAELNDCLGARSAGLRFDFGVAPVHVAGRLSTVLVLVAQELEQPSGLAASQAAGRHLEGLVLDGLLLGQPHNHSEAAIGLSSRAPGGVIKRPVDLIEERPVEPWTNVGLATELHLRCGLPRQGSSARWAWRRRPTSEWSTAACPCRSQRSRPRCGADVGQSHPVHYLGDRARARRSRRSSSRLE